MSPGLIKMSESNCWYMELQIPIFLYCLRYLFMNLRHEEEHALIRAYFS